MSSRVIIKQPVKIKIAAIRLAVQLSVLVLMFTGVLKMSNWIIAAAFAAGLFVGPVFCGWICPFGFIQEMIGELGKKIRKRFNIKLSKPQVNLKFLRYMVLGIELILLITVLQYKIVIPDAVKYAAVGTVLLLNLLSQRFFCKFICPLGALLSITNLLKVFTVKKESSCPNCGKCGSECMMNVDLKERGDNRDPACIGCFKCVDACPGSGSYLHF